jgi:hypothetical protein
MNYVNSYLNFIPLDKSWITRMGSLDIINGSISIESKLSSFKNVSDDLSALVSVSSNWRKGEILHVGESATLYRILQFASWKFNLNKQFTKEGSLLERVVISDPHIINLSQEELLKLDNGTTQWATASVICGDVERLKNAPSKLTETYNAVEEWYRCKSSGTEWTVRYDKTILEQVECFLTMLKGDKANFTPLCSDDFCFARAFDFITSEKGLEKWPSLVGHETNRINEMEKSLAQAFSGEIVDTLDHRVIQSVAMWGMINNKHPNFKHKNKVAKSWPDFFGFLNEVEKQNGEKYN